MVSDRIKEISSFITNRDKYLIDVGSDHNFLGLFVSQHKKVLKYTCIEIAEGPLEASIKNTEKYGDKRKFDFILNDGLKNLHIKNNQDVLIISGMGSPNIVNIIKNIDKRNKIKRYVCQTNNKSWILRKYLKSNNYIITKEKVISDNGIYYEILEFRKRFYGMRINKSEIYTGKIKNHLDREELFNKIKHDYNKIKVIDNNIAKKDVIKRKIALETVMKK
jgi:tRNA (adenine22-N1)-methyltransferase